MKDVLKVYHTVFNLYFCFISLLEFPFKIKFFRVSWKLNRRISANGLNRLTKSWCRSVLSFGSALVIHLFSHSTTHVISEECFKSQTNKLFTLASSTLFEPAYVGNNTFPL